MAHTIDFSIIFPVMNQEDHIEKVIRSYNLLLKKSNISFELIAVINGTYDKSFKICKKLEKKLPVLHAFEIQGRSGFGLGIIYGLRKAKGRNLCYLNCARVYASDLLCCILRFQKCPENIIHGVRAKRDVWYRKLSSVIYNGFCQLLLGFSSKDINGTPKIFSREHMKVLPITYTDSMIDVELLDEAKKNHIPIVEVPVMKNIRHGGKSTSTFTTVFRLMREVGAYWVKTRFFSDTIKYGCPNV